MAIACASAILATGAVVAQDMDENEISTREEWLASRTHEEHVNQAKALMDGVRLLARGVSEEEFANSTPPFNVAAAVKYSAEYEWRSRNPGISPELQGEFRVVAANLAYDVVAEAADAAELCAEMAGITNDKETAEFAALLAAGYYAFAEEFISLVRESEGAAAGQRVIRARAAAARADRFAERLEP